MILTCNSCGKKFVVPDNAITSSGRVVQCGSCGNKWRQFPIDDVKKNTPVPIPKTIKKTIQKPKKIKKNKVKSREVSLYSPEYLAKKHGIMISNIKPQQKISQKKETVSFGFYNSLILFIVLIVSISRLLFFSQDFIINKIPASEFYLNYFFESIRNIFEIWKDLVSNY